ncbi:EF-P 5-aminopentanol modification-associated protein YfmF [Sutcliffiella halmapala]|uniref:EF-P 5-aminopentanol modification-associated protein YfmF n=1 Tax=Sutcliffiella halmapala TaxID=79882 RepID=UPI000994A12E|nr:pitrilysin family protein [Sutcliffiella halmapala]
MKLIDERTFSLNGVKVHSISTKKFKTNTLVLKVMAPLLEEDVTLRALLPYVLQNGTKSHPQSSHFRGYLDELYGASLAIDLSKKGESHIITFRLEIANEKFLKDSTPLLEKGIQLLSEVLLQPVTENGVFVKTTLEKEKRALKQRIQSVYDDKMRYASQRLVEEMCAEEPYRLPANGLKEQVDEITPESLYHYYEQMLATNDIQLYVVGDIEEAQVESFVKQHFTIKAQDETVETIHTKSPVSDKEPKEIVERQDIKQGKLNIGYRTNVTFNDDLYYALQVYNGILGGFSHSKLFINVREKESLAYYAASRVESHKGLLLVMSGIDFGNFDKAVSIINKQIEAMKQGDYSEAEIAQTKAVIKNQILETVDTARGLIEIHYNNEVAKVNKPVDDFLDGLEKVTKEEIQEVAKLVELDTIYFLTGKEA